MLKKPKQWNSKNLIEILKVYKKCKSGPICFCSKIFEDLWEENCDYIIDKADKFLHKTKNTNFYTGWSYLFSSHIDFDYVLFDERKVRIDFLKHEIKRLKRYEK